MTGCNFHPEAAADLEDIWEFTANDSFSDYENVNFDAADRVIGEILTVLDRLAAFPNRGHKRPDLTARPLRFILVGERLIAYAPDEKPLWVVAIMHGRRNPRVMAAILRARK